MFTFYTFNIDIVEQLQEHLQIVKVVMFHLVVMEQHQVHLIIVKVVMEILLDL
jgi:hypothetical protein